MKRGCLYAVPGALAIAALTALAACSSGPPSAASMAGKLHCTSIMPGARLSGQYVADDIMCTEPDHSVQTGLVTFSSQTDEKAWLSATGNGLVIDGPLWVVVPPSDAGIPEEPYLKATEKALGGGTDIVAGQ
jgi:hypothetical protein